MYGVLIALEILTSILLIIVVLMQSSKGGGLAGSFGGGNMGTVFGVRRTADFLSKSTWVLAAIFIGLCLIINIFFLPGRNEAAESIIQRSTAPTSVPRPSAPRTVPQTTPAQQPAK
ncbi:MAG TPA: preprotein translocase subunit SecG [Bacteroidota bacterium]|nr:preprotein translocase subunit SecG [Bacteroidota bacterium]